MENQDLYLKIQGILDTETSELISNNLKKSGQLVEYIEIAPGIEEFKSTLRLFNSEAFSYLFALKRFLRL